MKRDNSNVAAGKKKTPKVTGRKVREGIEGGCSFSTRGLLRVLRRGALGIPRRGSKGEKAAGQNPKR